MAASEPPPDEQPPPQNPPLPYKTWVLKVSIHCQACKRKVKKVLQSIEGVYITEIDEKQHKVTVTGNVEAEPLIKKLIRSGKNAEMWHEKPSFKEKKFGNPKSNDSKQEGAKSDDDDDDEEEEDKAGENADGQKPKSGGPSVRFDVPPQANAAAGAPAGQGPKKKKKKKKKKKSNSAAPAGSNNAPPGNAAGPEASKMGPHPPPHGAVDQRNFGHPYPPPQYPPSYAPQQAYVVSYNAAAQPAASGAPGFCYAPSSPYTYAYTRAEVHSMRCRPLDSFEILSDENPNACYIM